MLLHLVYDLPTHYQIVYVRNFIHMFENVRNFVRNYPKSIIISSENFCPKIECPKIKRPKILDINVMKRDVEGKKTAVQNNKVIFEETMTFLTTEKERGCM